MKPLRIGVIGAGSMGRNHIRILSAEKGSYELIGFFDADERRAAEVAQQFGVQAFPSAEALFGQVDAVTIAVPSSKHKELAQAAVKHRVHALVEKPLALTVSDAETMAAAFASAGLVLAVGHVERYNPVVTELCKLLQHERLLALEVRRYSPYNGRINDADVVQDLMIHDIDLVCNALLRQEPVRISTMGESHVSGRLDFVQSLLQFAQGTIVSISASRVTESKVRELVVHTDRSYIVADLLNRTLSVLRNTNLVIDEGKESAYRQDSVTQRIFVPMVEPLRMELMDFIACIQDGRAPAADGRAACCAIGVAETIIRQAETRQRLTEGGSE